MKKDFNQNTIIYLNTLMATNFILTCMEELEGTPIFKQQVKNAANRFKKEILKSTETDLNAVWGIEDESMYNLMDHQEKLLKEIALMRPENYGVLNAMIERYKMSPEAIQNWLGVKIIEKEEMCNY